MEIIEIRMNFGDTEHCILFRFNVDLEDLFCKKIVGLLKVRQFLVQHVCSTVMSLHFLSGIGQVNKAQIEDMASKPEYALVRPSADDLAPLSAEVIQDTCAG